MTRHFISILMPTRGRPLMAIRAVESIRSTLRSPEESEVVFRIDDDDTESCARASELARNGRVVIGPRLRGYADVNTFYTEAARIADGTWLWLANDDIECSGTELDTLLEKHVSPNEPCIVKVDDGFTGRGGQAIFPIIPRIFIDALGRISPHYSSDSYLFMLARASGFPTYFIEQIKITHHRDPLDPHQIDALAKEHRGDWHDATMKETLLSDADKLRRYQAAQTHE